MEDVKYVGERSLNRLLYLLKSQFNGVKNEIKRELGGTVLTFSGSVIWVDATYLARPDCPEAIDSEGPWRFEGPSMDHPNGYWNKVASPKEGAVYNVENSFETNERFTEGAGVKVAAGTNIVCINNYDGGHWDTLATSIDVSILQQKAMTTPIAAFTNETPTVYTSSASLPNTETVASATIKDQMVAIIGGDTAEAGDVYRASVAVNASDNTLNDITWTKLGNQNTVEGALAVIANTVPNTPITAADIQTMFNA